MKKYDKYVIVNGVENVEPRYNHDIELIQGEYINFAELKKTFESYDLFFSSAPAKIHFLVMKELNNKNIVLPFHFNEQEMPKNVMNCPHNLAARGYETIEPLDNICKVLDNHNIKYFHNDLTLDDDGIYNRIVSGGIRFKVVHKNEKIAEIKYEKSKFGKFIDFFKKSK